MIVMFSTGNFIGPGGRPGSGPLAAFFALAAAVSSAPGDQVILDDLIVDGSLAVGLDAVNGESFGFDTLRLKENNLRLHFDDTSVAAAFPRNDWRIVINDSNNGGDSYFMVEDVTGGRQPFRIEAGAASHSLFVDSQGDVGLGTNNPVLELHMADGDTPTMRLEQNGTSGWNPQTWDVAGNETNFFIRDVTHGSKLPFRIRADAPSNSLEIQASGNVNMPGSAEIGKGLESSSSPALTVRVKPKMAGGPDENVFFGADAIDGSDFKSTFNVEGDAFISETLEIGSSRERKEKIRELTLDEALGALEQLEPVEFHYKADPDSQLGFIAEDVPEIVATENRRSVRPMDFVAVLAKVVQEHQRRERELSETIGNQQCEIERLAERLEALENAAPPESPPRSADRTAGR
jgi:hypothetical protein